jgi:hypothetical protein
MFAHSSAQHDAEPALLGSSISISTPATARASNRLLDLQRSRGNAAVGRLLEAKQRETRQARSDAGGVAAVVRSAGGRLPDAVRAEMEYRLGADFSEVRVHADATADASAKSMNARAYTCGSHIVFRSGSADLSSATAKHVLAHELWHVVQQRSGPVSGNNAGGGLAVSHPEDRFEREAEHVARQALARPMNRAFAEPDDRANHDRATGVEPVVQRVRFAGGLFILGKDFVGDFEAKDTDFEKYLPADRDDEIVIAVLDTGIHASSKYLAGRMGGTHDASGIQDPAGYTHHRIKDLHGTKVAAQAAFGTDRIKLVDVRVQTGQLAGVDNSVAIADGIRWAITEKKAKVVTCSIDIDWAKPAIQAEVDKHPDVLFLTTAGNNDKRLTERKIDADGPERPNALLVGGVTQDGKKHRVRGWGPGVDVMVPSGSADDSERALYVHIPTAAAEHEVVLKGKNAPLDQETIDDYKAQGLDAIPGSESGVSFGLPVVANIAAKMRLISPTITAAEIVAILRDHAVQDRDKPELTHLSKSGGIIDAEEAYRLADEHRSRAASRQPAGGAGLATFFSAAALTGLVLAVLTGLASYFGW